jgi:uncharacterized protein YecE (DUF72 family)
MIRVGIGGWTYEPWRETFYPPDVPKAHELEHASRRVTAIEVNGTFYRTQTPATFAKWRDATPDDFVFTLKAPRYAVSRRVLAEAGESVTRFVESGVAELGPKLGAILWPLPPTHRFEHDDVAAFLAMLPAAVDGVPLRHALEVRHESFADPAFVALAREADVAIVAIDSEGVPLIADQTGPVAYARLRRCVEAEVAGYPAAELDRWAERARLWEAGAAPDDLPLLAPPAKPAATSAARPVFVFFISGFKPRAPAAAEALIARLKGSALG